MSAEWQDDAVDGVTWGELFWPFTRARELELRICHALAWELSCALQSADVRLDPGLEVLTPELEEKHAGNAFASFVDARQVACRPALLSPLPVLREQPVVFSQKHPRTSQVWLEYNTPEAHPVSCPPPPSKHRRLLRWTIINPIRSRL